MISATPFFRQRGHLFLPLGALLTAAVTLTASAPLPSTSTDWPLFRGPGNRGVADGHDLPVEFNGETGANVRWSTAIPGLAHSSPVIWGDTVYLTAAVAEGLEPDLLTGDSDAAGIAVAGDLVPHSWRLIAVDKATGELRWERVAHEGTPRLGRHGKASHASSTPATNGERIVTLFGTEGLFCFAMDGTLLWQRDVGLLDVGYWTQPEYQWGAATSPVIYDDLVLVQNDRQADSMLVAYSLETGDEVWRVQRDEKPAWSTPALYRGDRDEIILNGARYFTAYDPRSGEELWRLSNDDAQVIVPTPLVVDDRVILTGGNPTGARPITAVRLGGRGDITPPSGAASGGHVLWQAERGSPYTPTPIAYRGILYVIVDNGILSAYDLDTGERLYRTRLAVGAGFSASPVASDGRLYFPSEDGDVHVVAAGPEFELLASNPMGEILMASPAISDGTLYIRGRGHLFAIGR